MSGRRRSVYPGGSGENHLAGRRKRAGRCRRPCRNGVYHRRVGILSASRRSRPRLDRHRKRLRLQLSVSPGSEFQKRGLYRTQSLAFGYRRHLQPGIRPPDRPPQGRRNGAGRGTGGETLSRPSGRKPPHRGAGRADGDPGSRDLCADPQGKRRLCQL